MAKKRRRPQNRSHPQGSARSAVRTAEPPVEDQTGAAEHNGGGGSGPQAPARARTAGPHRTRAEKKELARQQREEIRRQMRRAQRMRQLLWISGAAAAIAVAFFLITGGADDNSTDPESLPGMLTTEAPWPPNADQAAARAEAIGLPSHGDTLAMHEHANLQIFVHGEPVTIPVNVGIDEATGDVASLHTHTADGVVHIESSTVAEFTLGQFFDVWGVRLTSDCIGGDCISVADELLVFKDGERVNGPIRQVGLDDQSVIVVTFGTADELPDPIPSTFDFTTVQP